MNIVYCIFIGILLVGAPGCEKVTPKQTPPEKKPEKPPVAVEAAVVSRGSLAREIRTSGIAAGIREAYVVSETQGRIESVHFSLGQRVTRGDLLVEVSDAIQKAAYEQAKKAAAAAELNLTVTEQLFNNGSASDAELKNAQSMATGARTQLASARKSFSDCRILAPISGSVAQKELTIETGNILAGGALVTRIVDISSLKTTLPVGEMEVGAIKNGMKAHVIVPALGEQVFDGKVSAIAAGSNPATGSYPVEVTWRNTADRLIKSGMSVRVVINTAQRDSTILIPQTAVFQKEYKDAVFTAIDSTASIRLVETGRVIRNSVEIRAGLAPGEFVITTGIAALSQGAKVAVTVTGESGGMQ